MKRTAIITVLRVGFIRDRPELAAINAGLSLQILKTGVLTAGKCFSWLSHGFVSSDLWSVGSKERVSRGEAVRTDRAALFVGSSQIAELAEELHRLLRNRLPINDGEPTRSGALNGKRK